MALKIQPPEIPDDDFEMTPMIDIIFLLIIFFMVVAQQITQKVPLEVPVADEAQVPETIEARDKISIDEEGQFYLGMTPTTLDELEARWRENIQTIKGFKVYIRADEDTPHEHVREAMNAAARAGVFNIVFATFQEEIGR